MKGFKTIIFGIMIALIGAFSTPEMQTYVAANLPWFAPLLGGIIIALRAITTSSIFKPE